MPQFKPYEILHLQVADISSHEPPAGNALCYFWWRTIPLGHLWLESANLSSDAFRQRMVDCIYPTLKNYIDIQGTKLDQPLTWCLKKFSGKELDNKLESLLATSLLDENSRIAEPVSVVICTRNRPGPLKECITSIMQSSDQRFELVVVDNAPSDDKTKEVVSQFPNVKYVLEPNKGLDYARNAGLRNASHSIIAYTDDDVIIPSDWISNLKKCFSDPLTMAVTGMVFPVALQHKSQYLFERYWGFNKGYAPRTFDEQYFKKQVDHGVPVWDIGAGANMAFRKQVLEVAGFFDERLDVGAAGCSGDSEMWYRILAEGWNCFYRPQLFVYHQHRETEKALHNQIFNYMRGQVASLFVQHETYGHRANLRRIYRQLPKYYFKRILRALLRGPLEKDITLLTEIRGCVSGWRFYHNAKNRPNSSNESPSTESFEYKRRANVNPAYDQIINPINQPS